MKDWRGDPIQEDYLQARAHNGVPDTLPTTSAIQRSFAALGLAVIYLSAFILPLVDSRHDFIYHLKGSPSRVFLPVLIDIGLLTLLLFLVLSASERSRRFAVATRLGLLLWVPWSVLRGVAASLVDWHIPSWLGPAAAVFTAITCLALCLIPASSRGLQRGDRLVRTLLIFGGLNGLLVLVQLTWFALAARPLDHPPALHHTAAAARPGSHRGRVIWVLLDELAWDQVYEHRDPGLALPAFDRLAAGATLFTHTIPAEIMTEKAVPSMITGLPVSDIETSAAGKLLALHEPGPDLWHAFDPTQTVFEDALRDGYSTSVVGWYNPYCRILAPVLDHCFWRYTSDRVVDMRPDASLTRNVFRPLSIVWGLIRGKLFGVSPDNLKREDHVEEFLALDAAARSALADPSQTMLLLHMPVPHPPAIFDRHTGLLKTLPGGSYLDNLALADRWLGTFQQQLIDQGEWDDDTVVVMGDHSWRTSMMWQPSAFWTAEDQHASRNASFDDRPVYIVKLPGQRQAARIETSFSALRTRALLNCLFQDAFATPVELSAWVKRGASR